MATGRLDLSFRVACLSIVASLFLLILAAAIASIGRVRRFFFYALLLALPVIAIAAIEVGAIAIDLANRLAPIEDLSILARKERWPAHLMSNARLVGKDGVTVYRPWHGEGVVINEHGLRTAPPQQKEPGRSHIALTGGSVAWGWRVRDVDTIASQVQAMLNQQGRSNVTVYNFGIEAVSFAEELALLQRFRSLYSIDQVVFFTGANDATYSYLHEAALIQGGSHSLVSSANQFELFKAALRLAAGWTGPSVALAAQFDEHVLPKLARDNTLRRGLIAAGEYCRSTMMLCHAVLQPMLLRRKGPKGPEIAIARTLNQIYPRYDAVISTMYEFAHGVGVAVQDLSGVFDAFAEPVFVDAAHVNEVGNRLIAAHIAALLVSAPR